MDRELQATSDIAEYQNSLHGPGWLAEIRKSALDRFQALAWPTTSEEEWRRTSLSAFAFDDYRIGSGESSSIEVSAPDGLVAGSLTDLAAADAPDDVLLAVQRALEGDLAAGDNRLQFWNLALLADTAVVYVPKGIIAEEPVVVDFSFSGDEVVHSSHLVVILDEGASASVVKRISSGEEGEVMLVDADRLIVGANASLRFATLQSLNDESLVFSNGAGILQRDARLHRTEVNLGADFVKSRFECGLAGSGADAMLNGIYFPTDEQHVDVRTVQKHLAARTSSRAYYRGAVLGESHSIYQGLITVSSDAKGTDAYLTNRNLVLSEDARADSIPSLNIGTDDVKCSHGSTTGKIDEDQVFYLQSRGYTRDEASLLLIEGYFEDVIRQTPDSLQERIRDLISERLSTD